jgi:hypothetical protein
MGWVVNATPRPLYPRERPDTRCIGGWVGPRDRLDGRGKSRPHRDSIPVASRYTDYAIPVPDYGLRIGRIEGFVIEMPDYGLSTGPKMKHTCKSTFYVPPPKKLKPVLFSTK